MKKLLLCLILIAGLNSSGFAQDFRYGLKAGINQTMGGQITGNKSGPNNDWHETIQGNGKTGFHLGGFFQYNFENHFFIRVEGVYTSIESSFEFPKQPSIYAITKFDVPFLVGYNIMGPLDIYAGPVYSNIMDATLMGDEHDLTITVQEKPVNANVGVKLEFERFGIDLRYEHVLFPGDPQRVDIRENGGEGYGANVVTFDDPSLNQVILSLTFKIGESGMEEKRIGSCFF